MFIIIFFAGPFIGFAQNNLKKANKLFSDKNYCEALHYYDLYLGANSNKDIYLKRGISNFHCRNLDKAIEDIENAITLGNLDNDAYLYLAKSYQEKQEFEHAINYYKIYLNYTFKKENEKLKILDLIKKCSNGVYLKYKTPDHFIENWGPKINSPFNEIIPIQSDKNNSQFYFSSDKIKINESNKKFKENSAKFSEGEWKDLIQIPVLNSNHNIAFLDEIPQSDSVVFFMGNDIFRGSIYKSKLIDKQIDANVKLKFDAPIFSESGFNHLQFINDSTIVFSSDRQGGYGGYDLYITGKRHGQWFVPINLGAEINTKYDEIDPSVTPDGITLFFSSNNEMSVGGLDIFRSEFNTDNEKWSTPVNIGLPANSSANEINFRVLSSGLGAMFSSDRMDQSYGNFDLFWLYFKNSVNISEEYAQELPFIRNKNLKFPEVFPDNIQNTEIIQNPADENISGNEIPVEIITDHEEIHEEKPKEEKVGKLVNSDSLFSLQIPFIFFKDSEFLENKELEIFLDKLSSVMMNDENIKVEFVGNAYSWGGDNNDIVRSVRFSQRLADSLKIRMIDKKRIIVKGSGPNYPYAKINGPERSKNLIVKLNNRIDVYLHNYDKDKLQLNENEFFLNRSLLDTRHTLYETIIDGLTYRIQIKSSNALISDDLLSEFNDSGIEYDSENQVYNYTVGIYKEYKQAKELMQKLIANYKSNVTVIPYINGLRIPKNDILNYAKTYNDLINYLADNK